MWPFKKKPKGNQRPVLAQCASTPEKPRYYAAANKDDLLDWWEREQQRKAGR